MTNFQMPCVVKVGVTHDSRGRFLSLLQSEIVSSDSGFGEVQQVNLSYSASTGTVRGMHGQLPPYSEAKIVFCVKGRIFDVLLDVRRDSPTFLELTSFELSAEELRGLVIPRGYLHGFQSLSDDVEILYLHDQPYRPSSEMRINPLDPSLGISWPKPVAQISNSDSEAPSIGPDFEGLVL